MFYINFQSRVPIYEQLRKNVIKLATIGLLKENEQLPTVRSLAKQLGVNPNTVQKAYQLLEHEGIIDSIAGKGSFISQEIKTQRRKKEFIEQALKPAILELMDMGVEKQDVLNAVEKIFIERRKKNDSDKESV